MRGEVLIKSYASPPENIAAYGPLADETGSRSIEITALRVTSKGIVARLKGVSDRNAAEALEGIGLYVPRSALPASGESEFYHADLIGLAAVAPDGTAIGEVVAVPNYGAGDLIEFRLTGKDATQLVPFHDSFVPEVDLINRRIVVVIPVPLDEEPMAGS